jgi:hypothetical protein
VVCWADRMKAKEGVEAPGVVSSLSKFRLKKNPVRYSVEFTHDETGCSFTANGVNDTPHDRLRLAEVLENAARSIREEVKANP